MVDLVVGLGEIGKPLYDLLRNRNFKVDGYDIDPKRNLTPSLQAEYDMVHICISYSEKFIEICRFYKSYSNIMIIHSTVPPGTSNQVGAVFSPVRGVHHNMYNHLEWFTKFYASKEKNIQFEKRFPKSIRVDDNSKLERTKVTDLKYYGLLIAFRKYVDQIGPIYWEFEIELNQMFGNKPIMYNDEKKVGGHCVLENMGMAGEDEITRFIREWGGIDL